MGRLTQVLIQQHRGRQLREAPDAFPSGVPVRDSKAPDGPAVVFPATSWSAFVTTLRSDDFPA
ncbi:DUF397 domain-containing protein [Streptomyces anulatus]|uniref:DUF397 domain-containing protein n=1 Tax=Streptomyces anulatus TaxID=1892 RepID=UPI002ED2B028